jgi:ketosteroid isomerase-like protein
MAAERGKALAPEDLTRLFVERANAGDVDGLVELYARDAVLAFPPGEITVGRDAIRALYERMLASRPTFQLENPLPTLRLGNVALTATPARDEAGARAQVAMRQADGSWVRVLDRPDFRS